MLNASQVRTNRAALVEASMSSTPASAAGWLPTTPIETPSSRANPQNDVARVMLMHLEELAVVDDHPDRGAHS